MIVRQRPTAVGFTQAIPPLEVYYGSEIVDSGPVTLDRR